jgi:hypothetical protein
MINSIAANEGQPGRSRPRPADLANADRDFPNLPLSDSRTLEEDTDLARSVWDRRRHSHALGRLVADASLSLIAACILAISLWGEGLSISILLAFLAGIFVSRLITSAQLLLHQLHKRPVIYSYVDALAGVIQTKRNRFDASHINADETIKQLSSMIGLKPRK